MCLLKLRFIIKLLLIMGWGGVVILHFKKAQSLLKVSQVLGTQSVTKSKHLCCTNVQCDSVGFYCPSCRNAVKRNIAHLCQQSTFVLANVNASTSHLQFTIVVLANLPSLKYRFRLVFLKPKLRLAQFTCVGSFTFHSLFNCADSHHFEPQ